MKPSSFFQENSKRARHNHKAIKLDRNHFEIKLDERFNRFNKVHVDYLYNWVCDRVSRKYDDLKEGCFHLKDEIKERVLDFYDEMEQVRHPKPKIIKIRIAHLPSTQPESTHQKDEDIEPETSCLWGLDCSSLNFWR